MHKGQTDLDEGGAKQKDSRGEPPIKPALKQEDKQAQKNQSSVQPEDYPDRQNKPETGGQKRR